MDGEHIELFHGLINAKQASRDAGYLMLLAPNSTFEQVAKVH